MGFGSAKHWPRLAALTLLLTMGCVGPQGRDQEPPAIFTLQVRFASQVATKKAEGVLVVAPHARPGYDTERMAYVRKPNELEYFAHHRWVDTPSRMLAPLIAASLEATGAFSAVVQAPTVARTRWRLETELIELEQDFLEKPSQARLALRAQLVDATSQQLVAARVFSVSVPSDSEDPRGGVQAANAATATALRQLAEWCIASLRPATPR
jgi:cholesterol transport system auxiliary component